MNRATGRTYRKCLKAVLAASEGKKVLFVVGNSIEMMGILKLLEKLTNGFTHYKNQANFYFKNEGFVTVRYIHSDLRGTKYDEIIEDELLGLSFRDIEQYLQKTKPTLLR